MTDLCEYCEKEIVFKNKIAKLLENEFNQFQKDYNISNLMNEIRKKAMIIKNQIKNATNETNESKALLESNYLNLKSATDNLRDYEVIKNFI